MDSVSLSVAAIILAGIQIVQIWPGAPFVWLEGFCFCFFFENFLVLWHNKVSQTHLVHFVTYTWIKPFLQGTWVHFSGE